ncbi:MAG: hypothetical protein RBQ97_03675 [Acholeplasma sp.]|nr:hypothetical protein [Acholeplasma sp.]
MKKIKMLLIAITAMFGFMLVNSTRVFAQITDDWRTEGWGNSLDFLGPDLRPGESFFVDGSDLREFEHNFVNSSNINFTYISEVDGKEHAFNTTNNDGFIGLINYIEVTYDDNTEIIDLEIEIEAVDGRVIYINDSFDGGGRFIGDFHLFSPFVKTSVPAISGKDTIINNVSSPYTLDQIKNIAEIVALDEYEGNITSKITVKTDSYSANKAKKGTYQITYKVTNTAGLSTEYTLNVVNQDFDKPILTGPSTSSISYKTTVSNADIINKYTATDNYDTTLTIKVDSTNYVANKVGTYTYNLSVSDSSGNKTTATHTLTVVDDVKPVITDVNEGIVQFNFKDKITNADLLLNISASDEVDGNLTSQIKVVDNPIEPKLGVYTVVYEVSDKAGNKQTYSREFEIITTSLPKIYVSENLLSIEDVNEMTIDQLAQVYATYNNIEMMSYEVLVNEYEGNETTAGTYTVRLSMIDVNDEEHIVERQVRVFNQSELVDVVTLPWYTVAWNFISSVFVGIWNFIVSIFTAIWNFVLMIINWVIGLF